MSHAIHEENPVVSGLPANVTFHDLIRRNKRKSMMLMCSMGLLFVLVGTSAVALIEILYVGVRPDELGISLALAAVVSVIVGVLAGVWSFYNGANTILRISGAKLVKKVDDPQLYNIVEEIAIAGGIPVPKVYLINDTALNAFATGRDPEHGAVAITTGLRSKLSRDELAGVIAHEIAHIRHYDIRFAMLMATMVGLIVFASDALWHLIRYQFWFGGVGGRRSRSNRRDSGGGQAQIIIMVVVLVIVVILLVIAPMLASLIRLAVSREREFLADAGAVELTRYPQGLISALEKLGACREPLEVANRATAHLYIVNPLKSALKGKGHELKSAFRTHPPLHDRIARLRALTGENAAV